MQKALDDYTVELSKCFVDINSVSNYEYAMGEAVELFFQTVGWVTHRQSVEHDAHPAVKYASRRVSVDGAQAQVDGARFNVLAHHPSL